MKKYTAVTTCGTEILFEDFDDRGAIINGPDIGSHNDPVVFIYTGHNKNQVRNIVWKRETQQRRITDD